MLNLHQLIIFAVVVELKSVTQAAEHLHLTQPAVSAQLRHLRAFVGQPILQREARGVVPTEAGTVLYEYAQEVLGATDAFRRDLTKVISGEFDRIVVAGARSYGTYVLPRLLSGFQLRHPTLTLSVVDARSEDIVERVRGGSVDIGVVLSAQIPEEWTTAMVVSRLGDDELIIIESGDRPFSTDQTLTLEEASRIPYVRALVGQAGDGAVLDPLLASRGLPPQRVVMEFTTWEGIKEAVRDGVGIATTFRSVVDKELASGELRTVRIEGYRDVRGVSLICSPHRRRVRWSPVLVELLALLKREVRRVLESSGTPA